MIKTIKILLALSLVLSFEACREEAEGCLDVNASNFDPSADVSCCCEYPQLSLRFSFEHYDTDTTIFGLNTVYLDAANQPYQIQNLNMYCTDFELITVGNEVVRVQDSLDLMLQNGTLWSIIDDVILLRPSRFSYNLGTFRANGDFKALRFRVGLGEQVRQNDPTTVAETHPLHSLSDMYDNGYIFTKIEAVRDTADQNSVTLYALRDNVLTVELPTNLSILAGFDTEINLNADLKKLFETIDFQNDDFLTIENKIKTKIPTIFTIKK